MILEMQICILEKRDHAFDLQDKKVKKWSGSTSMADGNGSLQYYHVTNIITNKNIASCDGKDFVSSGKLGYVPLRSWLISFCTT